ncbi:MAG: hypothetical protein AAGI66_05570 [Cyanobacteria bacterium P01_H01_bin.74]
MKSFYPQCIHRFLRPTVVAVLVLSVIFALGNSSALAKKKGKKGKSDKEVEKILEPVQEDMDKLVLKMNGGFLFSPQEAQKMLEIKFTLIDLIDEYPKSKLVIKPVYQFGLLLQQREAYNDAYELLSFLADSFPDSAYGVRAKTQLNDLMVQKPGGMFDKTAAGRTPVKTVKSVKQPAKEMQKDPKKVDSH